MKKLNKTIAARWSPSQHDEYAYLLSKKIEKSCHDETIAPRWQNPEAIMARCLAMERDGQSPLACKTINRALLLHNYSFRNLEKYKTLRRKGEGVRRAQELSREGDSPPSQGDETSSARH
ncbi:hypothetical protein A2U01_0036426 [Trifolium medium]|uniref:Uncharacterized protein n=1 Tax=Trifolium medium TaxID=97028 RepID=A0A392PT64_9FABA|nr:hypothetical protein [Trifolium medium]